MFEVELLPAAEKTFAQADAILARKLARCLRLLEIDPLRHPNIKPLIGPLKGFFRFRIGDYRVVYRIDSKNKTVYVVRIVHRKEAYE
ncbi:MAG: type II toxin-antitoxin system RelE/ParE family toxin [Pirellulales bacterium]|nr:type II toxin-antitoxin system RelE/ParE family toxin [Pirellulales bacterium]